MFKRILLSGIGALVLILSQGANALPIDLYDYAFNVDGTVTAGTPGAVDCVNDLGLDTECLGSLSFIIGGTGSHFIDLFLDYEIAELSTTFFNEYGSTGGTAAAGQSWEIDEPGYVFGDIYDNMLASTLDGFNDVPFGLEDDVSFGLGWDFVLADGETAAITFFMSDVLDTTGFYLQHTDDDAGESVYFWSTLEIRGGETPVPEPGTLWLFGAGLIALGLSRRKRTMI